MITADKVLSEIQLNKFLKKLRGEKDKSLLTIHKSTKRLPKEVRVVMDYYLFAILAHTGLRISEALNLKWSDTHDDFLIVRAEISKNRKRGTVYFGPKTRAILNELMNLRTNILKRVDTDLLFSHSGKIPSRSYAHSRFKYWIAQCSLPSELSIHSLRLSSPM